MAWYVDPASAGGVGSEADPYNAIPSNSFATGTWYLKAGSTLTMGATGLTTGNNAIIGRYGTGANPIISSSASTILDSSTATGVEISDITITRSGGVTGIGLQAFGTTSYTVQRCSITGSQTNLYADRAVSLQVLNNSFGAASGSYGIRGNAVAGVECSDWTISGNTFDTDIHIELNVSNASNDAGTFTGLQILNNNFNASASSAIIMQSPMNATDGTLTVQVTGASTITTSGTWPAWTAGQVIFLSGFTNIANYGPASVVSIVGTTLTVGGITLVAEAGGVNKGAWLVDDDRAFIAPTISGNVCEAQLETPMLLASIVGGTISNNRLFDGVTSSTGGGGGTIAAAIEMGNCRGGLVVSGNTIDNFTGADVVDNAGIFTDGGCDGVIVRGNTISNMPGGATYDNSGMGTAFFYAQNCIHENNAITNCNRGTWMGGVAGAGNIARNNVYRNNRIAIKVNSSPASGALVLNTNRFDANDVNLSGITETTVYKPQSRPLNYTPKNPPDDPALLPAFLRQELSNIRETLFGAVDSVILKTLYSEPTKVSEGMVVKADGTTWDPGDGVGVYARISDAWQILASIAAGFTTTVDNFSGLITSPSDKTYTLVLKCPHGGTITETTTKSVSGTCTATFKVNTTALGGTANSVSSSETSQAHTTSNTFAAGDDIVVTVSSNSSCADFAFTIKYSRAYP